MALQDLMALTIAAMATLYLVRRLIPRSARASARPDVKAGALVRKKSSAISGDLGAHPRGCRRGGAPSLRGAP